MGRLQPGAYKALQENGRTEIKLYSIDVSNQDLQLMRQPGSPWKQTVAVDSKLIGAVNMRLLAQKIAGEPTPASYQFKASAIDRAALNGQQSAVNVATLNKILPGWGESNDFVAPGSPRWRQSTGKVMQKTGRRAGLFAVRQAGRLRFSQGAAKQREQQRSKSVRCESAKS